MRRSPKTRLSTLVAAAVFLCSLGASAVIAVTLLSASQMQGEQAAVELLQHKAQAANTVLGRSLYVQWRELQALASFANAGEPSGVLRLRMQTMKAANDRYAWIGIAEPNGIITIATDGVLQGKSAAQRPWFLGGIERPFAGDLHEAVLLKDIVPADDGPPRLIDLAAPLRTTNGQLTGVIAAHVGWPWFRDLVRTQGQESGVDVLLVSRNGSVLAGSAELQGSVLTVRSALAARQGVSLTATETWPDGVTYLVSVIPTLGFRDLPSFGWSLVVRQRADLAFASNRSVASRFAVVALVTLALLAGTAIAVGRFAGRPAARLAEAARVMAANPGQLVAPIPDERSYAEVAAMSSALAAIQGRIATSLASDEPSWEKPRLVGAAAQ